MISRTVLLTSQGASGLLPSTLTLLQRKGFSCDTILKLKPAYSQIRGRPDCDCGWSVLHPDKKGEAGWPGAGAGAGAGPGPGVGAGAEAGAGAGAG